MSLQLIVFPQSYNGLNSLAGLGTQCVADGINFTSVNTSSSTQNIVGSLPSTYLNATTFNINTWYRFSGVAAEVTEVSGNIVFVTDTGIVQKLSNLTVGAVYDFTIEFNALNVSGIRFYQRSDAGLTIGNPLITGITTQTISFTAISTTDVIVLYSLGATQVASLSVRRASTSAAGVSLSNGQVICDLYEDEDIPLTLSVDEFKNAAEQVKSYSKAFNLPATKRNNLIFDNIFEITRADDGVVFNPYVKTQCILKQDGFVLFEGYLRMLDIQDKEGEVSYNVNLYSEVIALADVLGERAFKDLSDGFTELDHTYNKTNIKNSWNNTGATGIAYTNPSTSGFRNDNDTLKYPFIDWTHEFLIANGSTGNLSTHGYPELTSFEQAFRPCIQIKYLIDRIFNQTNFPFSYTSNFFNTADFEKLYMDFNWGDSSTPMVFNNSGGLTILADISLTGSFATINFDELNTILAIFNPGSALPSEMGYSSGVFTAVSDNQTYTINCSLDFQDLAGGYDCEWVHVDSAGVENLYGIQSVATFVGTSTYSASFTVLLQTGETLFFRAKETLGSVEIDSALTGAIPATFSTVVNISTNANETTSDSLLQTLRGELGQWEFLKGLMTMFNLISMPDKSDPNNILIEPYNDMFLDNTDSSELNWTNKVDIEEIKLTPLTELNRNTLFKFVEDDDDYAFQNYKISVQNHLYGSQLFDAETSSNGLATVLSGEEEIVAEPFAATVVKPLMSQFSDLIVPTIYSYNPDDDTSEGFDNSPRIMYNNGIKSAAAGTFTSCTYYIPGQNGTSSENATTFLQFSHLSAIPTTPSSLDFHFGICQLIGGVGSATTNNLFNTYWLPYFNELYNPDTRTMTIKVNLGAGDINTFKFYDTVMIKNRTFRVNKIDYNPNDLATVEFILIP
tara:strand:- start:2482 stop:5196 length:2715 start_codon:yes stop_codon:yes gene_type:complete